MRPQQPHKCEHDPCKCIVSAEDAYCSPQCEKRADNGEGPPCGCGHHDCDVSAAVPPATVAGMA